MPHIIIKMYSGRTEERKKNLVDNVARAVREALELEDSSVSISIEEVEKEKWAREVYKPEIIDKPGTLYKKPGYFPPELKQEP